MAKKKKDKKKKAKISEKFFNKWQIIFLVPFVLASIGILFHLSEKPYMLYSKGFRYIWIILFLSYIGFLISGVFRKFKFVNKKNMLIVFFVLVAIGYLYNLSGALYLSGDSGLYMILGKSLAEFKGYIGISIPNPKPHTLYGFGLPLLIAPALLFGFNILAANFVILLTSVGFVYFTYLLFKKYIGFELSILIAAIVAFNGWIMHFSTVIMTEIPFSFFMMMSFYFVDKYSERNTEVFSKYLYISAVLVFYTYEIKPIGLAIFGGAILFLIFKKEWKKLLFFGCLVMIGILLWNLRNYIYTGKLGYLSYFIDATQREGVTIAGREGSKGFGFLGNLFYKQLNVAFNGYSIFSPMIFHNILELKTFLKILIILVMYTGLFYNLIKNRSIFDFTVLVFFYAVVIYSFKKSPSRYYLPLIPFMYYYTFVGLRFLLSKFLSLLKVREEKNISHVFTTFLFSSFFILNMIPANKTINNAHPGSLYPSQALQDYYETGQWIKKNLPKDIVLASRLDKEMFIFSGIKSTNSRVYMSYDLNYTKEKGKQIITDLKKLLIDEDIDYFVLDSTRPDSYMTRRALAENQNALNEIFVVQYVSPSQLTYVLKVKEEWKKNNQSISQEKN